MGVDWIGIMCPSIRLFVFKFANEKLIPFLFANLKTKTKFLFVPKFENEKTRYTRTVLLQTAGGIQTYA